MAAISLCPDMNEERGSVPVFWASPEFRPPTIPPAPHSSTEIEPSLSPGSIMGTTLDHRRYAEECVAMARLAEDDQDKMLWLTLAQSWVRLAEHVERSAADPVLETQDD